MYKYEKIITYVKDLAEKKQHPIYISERNLANKLNISRMTVRKAFDQLAKENIIKRTAGQKTLVLKQDRTLSGVIASYGMAQGYAFIHKQIQIDFKNQKFTSDDNEFNRLQKAIAQARKYLLSIETASVELKDIIEVQLTMLNDPDFIDGLKNEIKLKQTAEIALVKTIENYEKQFLAIENEYLKARLKDLNDLKRLLIDLLSTKKTIDFEHEKQPIIFITDSLSTNDLALINPKIIVGIVTEKGGKTDHSAIVAQSLGIPMLVGVTDATTKIKSEQPLVVDCYEGVIRFLDELKINIDKDIKVDQSTNLFNNNVELLINADVYTNLDLLPYKTGIGLYRTEFLYQDEKPSITKQQKLYERLIEKTDGNLIIRTLDVGGDKQSKVLDLPTEANPFLGLRGIRYSLFEKTLFLEQLEALYLASEKGPLKIMFPMVSSLDEVGQIITHIDFVKAKLNKDFKNMSLGLMLETPILIYYLKDLKEHFDFISLGTNDLIQYLTASDRTNEKVSHTYQSFSPGVLKVLDQIYQTATAYGLGVGVCGQIASTPLGALILIGLGYQHLSVSLGQYHNLKSLISSFSLVDLTLYSKKAMTFKTEDQVIEFYETIINENKNPASAS
ncbi:MAG: phosphoenolpyruvate--protein phosphotransferase [Acholeplasmataceae bacterium]